MPSFRTRFSFSRCPVAPSRFPSRTQQHFKNETDINVILSTFMRTGVLPQRSGSPFYGDVSSFQDYRTNLEAVQFAQDCFSDLPAKVRSRFRNDPAFLLEFLQDPANAQEAISLGLVPAPSSVPDSGIPVSAEEPPSDLSS